MKKDFKKYSSRASERERAKRELLKLAEQTNVGISHARIRFGDDSHHTSRSRGGGNITAEGVFRESNSGYGFVSIAGEERDVFIPESSTANAIDGDTVKITYKRYLSDSGEIRTEGRITQIIEYGKGKVIGTVDSDIIRMHRRRAAVLYILPDDGKIKRRIFIRDSAGAKVGDKVIAKLIRDPYSYTLYADVISNLGKSESKEANYMAILEENEIDTEFSQEELAAAKDAADEPISAEGRTIRTEVIFTIDSESAKDLDDAISVEKNSDGTYTLGVHIADVSHYVAEKSALDRLVMRRGTSVYFTDKVVPMLPEALSCHACSLNPGEDKYALSAILTIGHGGEIIETKLEKSIIRSRIKGIYSEINQIFEGCAKKSILDKYSDCISSLNVMYELYKILAKKSDERGYIELESPESQIILDKNGAPTDIIRRERGDAEKLIEQFMLAANEGVATLLRGEDIPCVFRVHDAPAADKLSDFITYAHNLGFDTSYVNSEKCQPSDLARLIKEAECRGIAQAVSYACLRSMAKAVYSDVHSAHFGLGIENYCHFTSPIRRLSDLATHRIISKVIFGGKQKEKYKSYARRAAAAATEGELRAISAERRIENLYKVIYMSERIGNIYPATITSIASFGIFAMLENTCEGLIPITEIEGNFVFDEKNLSLHNSKQVYRIGDKIEIKMEEADMLRGKLRFSLVNENEE